MKINDWLKNDALSAKILICSDVKNGNRVIRKCNKNGVCRVNTECKHMSDIARDIFIGNAAKNGKLAPFRLLDDSTCAVIIDRLIRSNSHKLPFFKKDSMCSTAASEIMRIINVIRMNDVTREYMSTDEENIVSLRRLIEMYHNKLEKMGAHDSYTLMRDACYAVKPYDGVSFGLAEGTYLTDIELRLLEKISDGKYEKIELYDKQSCISPKFFAGRGYINEVRYIAESIKDKPFGKVNIFYTSEAYRSFIKAGLGSLKIPFTLSSSYPAAETDIVSFILSLLRWAENDFRHSGLENVFINPKMTVRSRQFFKDSSKITPGLDSYANYCKTFREEHSEEAEDRQNAPVIFYEALIRVFTAADGKYSPAKLLKQVMELALEFTQNKSAEKKLVMPALKEELELISFMGDEAVPEKEALRFLIDRLEHMNVSDTAQPDAVNVSIIGSGTISERRYNYICGLSAGDLLPKVTESFIMPDKQLLDFVQNRDNSETSEIRRQRQYDNLEFLIRSVLADKGSELYLGYSSFDLSRLTDCSPSVFYNKLCAEFGVGDVAVLGNENIILGNINMPSDKKWADIPETSENISDISEDEIDENDIYEEEFFDDDFYEDDYCEDEYYEEDSDETPLIEVESTPSRIDKLLTCPRKYFFMYKLYIPDSDFVKDSDKWLTPIEKGNLFHDAACEYAERVLQGVKPGDVPEKINDEVFNEIFVRIVDGFAKPCENPQIRKMESEELKTALLKYFSDLHKELHDGNKWIVKECEGEFSDASYMMNYDDGYVEKTLQINFEGRLDRVDHYYDDNGTEHLRIIDYKTTTKSIPLDEHSQHVLYSAALSKDKCEVEEFNYVTPFRNAKDNRCCGDMIKSFDDDTASRIVDVLANDIYEYSEKKDSCNYCKFKGICFNNSKEDM